MWYPSHHPSPPGFLTMSVCLSNYGYDFERDGLTIEGPRRGASDRARIVKTQPIAGRYASRVAVNDN